MCRPPLPWEFPRLPGSPAPRPSLSPACCPSWSLSLGLVGVTATCMCLHLSLLAGGVRSAPPALPPPRTPHRATVVMEYSVRDGQWRGAETWPGPQWTCLLPSAVPPGLVGAVPTGAPGRKHRSSVLGPSSATPPRRFQREAERRPVSPLAPSGHSATVTLIERGVLMWTDLFACCMCS